MFALINKASPTKEKLRKKKLIKNNMKTLKVKLDYHFKGDVKEKPQESTYNFIYMVVSEKNPQGLDGSYRRMFGRISKKLDEAIENDKRSIELEDAEFDLIKNAVREAKIKVQFVQNFILLEDAVEEAENNARSDGKNKK
jgi:uncharacterized protein YggL (DUF469 family)